MKKYNRKHKLKIGNKTKREYVHRIDIRSRAPTDTFLSPSPPRSYGAHMGEYAQQNKGAAINYKDDEILQSLARKNKKLIILVNAASFVI
jgi:hypothetical protein